MGLLTDSTAKKVIQGLVVSYSTGKITGSWTQVSLNVTTTFTDAYEYHRYAKCEYAYVGLTFQAAKETAAYLASQYTRIYYGSEFDSEDGEFYDFDNGLKLQGSITINKTSGCMYEVRVSISEDDAKISRYPTSNVQSLFSKENRRQYDI